MTDAEKVAVFGALCDLAATYEYDLDPYRPDLHTGPECRAAARIHAERAGLDLGLTDDGTI